MKTKRNFLIFPLLLVFAFIFTACSNNSASNDGTLNSSESIAESQPAAKSPGVTRRLKMTLNGEQVVTAELIDSPATEEFLQQLPLTLHMTDYANREKHANVDFTIDDSDLQNIQTPYEIGDVIYYPPGPTFAMYYDHDGREISAGMEVIARLDAEGIETLGSYADAVDVTVELSE